MFHTKPKMQNLLLVGSSVVVLMSATPVLANAYSGYPSCSTAGSTLNCNGGSDGYYIGLDETYTAVNLNNLEGSNGHVHIEQDGDISVSVTPDSNNLGKQFSDLVIENGGSVSLDQVIAFTTEHEGVPDEAGLANIQAVFALADADNDGQVGAEEMVQAVSVNSFTASLTEMSEFNSTVFYYEAFDMLKDANPGVADETINAFLATVEQNEWGDLNITDLQTKGATFLEENFDFESSIKNSLQGLYVGLYDAGTININNSMDLTGPLVGDAGEAGNVNITNSGHINLSSDDVPSDVPEASSGGILTFTDQGNITINNSGNIAAEGPANIDGIEAYAGISGNITIDNSGNITLENGSGISVNTGDGAVDITNSGNINVQGNDTAGIEAGTIGSNAVNIETSGDVKASGENSIGIMAYNLRGGDISITIQSGATVSGGSGATSLEVDVNGPAEGAAGIALYGSGNNSIVNNGRIDSENGQAIQVFEGTVTLEDFDGNQENIVIGSSNDVVTNTGEIDGNIGLGNGTNSLNNSGTVTGNLTTGDGDDSVDNSGTVTGDLALGAGNNTVTNQAAGNLTGNVTTADGDDAVTNAGTLTGDLSLGAGTNSVANSGELTGGITTGDGNDGVDNSGTLTGDLALGAGNNTVTNQAAGNLTGNVTTADGDDAVTNTGTLTGDLSLGAGTNSVANSGELTGGITTGDGNDSVTNLAALTGDIALGGGSNSFTNTGQYSGQFTSGTGNDTVGNEGTLTGHVNLDAGNNSVTNDAAATLTGNVSAGNGDDSISNAGTLQGNVSLADGTNTVTNTGTLTGDISSGTGNDTVTNSANVTGNADLGDGDNSVSNSGSWLGNIMAGLGLDSFTNSGSVEGNVDLGDGDNTVDNAGAMTGNLTTGSGNDTVSNSGLMSGDINLGGGTNSLTNSGVMTGTRINVGNGNTITNAGTLSAGGAGTIATTTVTGNYSQSADGNLVVDIDDQSSQQSDLLAVSGTASLAGTVSPVITNLSREIDGEFVIVTAQGGVTDNGAEVGDADVSENSSLTVTDLAGVDFELDYTTDNQVILRAKTLSVSNTLGLDEDTGSEDKNLQAFASYFDTANQSGNMSDGMTEVANALRTQGTSKKAKQAAERLIPQNQGQQAQNTVTSVGGFANAMLSCKVHSGDYAFTKEGQCNWAKVKVRKLDRKASDENSGAKETGLEAMGGVQFALWDELRLGIALGYEDSKADTYSLTQNLGEVEGQRFQGGVVLKNQWGPVNAYLNIAGSIGDYDGTRYVNMGGFTTAQSSQRVTTALTRLRLSYLAGSDSMYVKPIVDLGATYVNRGGYTETGAGAFNNRVESARDWLLSVAPSVEVGGQAHLSNGWLFRPYARAGVTFLNKDEISTTVNFANVSGVDSFTVTSGLDDVTADVEAGFYLLDQGYWSAQLGYEGRYSEDTKQHALSVKVGVNF